MCAQQVSFVDLSLYLPCHVTLHIPLTEHYCPLMSHHTLLCLLHTPSHPPTHLGSHHHPFTHHHIFTVTDPSHTHTPIHLTLNAHTHLTLNTYLHILVFSVFLPSQLSSTNAVHLCLSKEHRVSRSVRATWYLANLLQDLPSDLFLKVGVVSFSVNM